MAAGRAVRAEHGDEDEDEDEDGALYTEEEYAELEAAFESTYWNAFDVDYKEFSIKERLCKAWWTLWLSTYLIKVQAPQNLTSQKKRSKIAYCFMDLIKEGT